MPLLRHALVFIRSYFKIVALPTLHRSQPFMVSHRAWLDVDFCLTALGKGNNVPEKVVWPPSIRKHCECAILFLGKSGRAGFYVTSIVTCWKQMQLVRLYILKHSADVRCCRSPVYDNLLLLQIRVPDQGSSLPPFNML